MKATTRQTVWAGSAARAAALGVMWAASSLSALGCHKTSSGGALSAISEHPARATLRSFSSEAELKKFVGELAEKEQAERSAAPQAAYGGPPPPPPPPSPAGAPPPAQAAPAPSAKAEAAGSAASGGESITNVQHEGVDEGDIVKAHGDHLVVLRRGRLFTIKLGGDALQPVSAVDAFGPDIDPGGTWYDEMLIGESTVVVIGYSYARGGTEVGLFDIDRGGGLRHRSTYHLRSNDYYSSRNYASRLIGSKLVFYTPLYVPFGNDPLSAFPAVRRWHKGATESEFQPLVSATRVFRPVEPTPHPALHTVTICDLARAEMSCQATALFGPPGRVFYVSPSSVFVWTTEWMRGKDERERPSSVVYRLPLDGSAPSALKASGGPIDQFSFNEAGGTLSVVVTADSQGEAMWSSEAKGGEMALLRVPLEGFSDGSDQAPRSAYRPLPRPKEGYSLQNRFVGEQLLYGTGSGWGPPGEGGRGELFVSTMAGQVTRLPLPHGIDRIEPLGQDAVVVGSTERNMHVTSIALSGGARVAGRYVRKGASQGETRSHGFFYKPDGPSSGLIGLPVREAGAPGASHLVHDSAGVLFLRNDALQLSDSGSLSARPQDATDDRCRASCVDWYGNARPIFLQKRVFALLGYELVEGELSGGTIAEKRRVTFAPSPLRVAR